MRSNQMALCVLLMCAGGVQAANVEVVALSEGRATLIVDKGKPRTVRAGENVAPGVKLISANREGAIVEVDGKRETITLGSNGISTAAPTGTGNTTAIMADSRGHFMTTGSINGASIRFMVDTGATMVSMGPSDAKRAGINYLQGHRSAVNTANGIAAAYQVKLDEVRIGNITLNNVDGLVHESQDMPMVLLGMSFLSRVDMNREGETMTLKKRY
jgi:aspartyl protease family protein